MITLSQPEHFARESQNFSNSDEKWLPGVVTKVTGPLSYYVELSDGRVIRRHIDHLRSRQTGDQPGARNGQSRDQSHDQSREQEVLPEIQGLSFGVEAEATPATEEPEGPDGGTTTGTPTSSPPTAPVAPDPVIPEPTATEPTALRRSTRARAPPSYLSHEIQ